MTQQAFAILLASAFTFGCAAIYEMRGYAREMIGILFRVALCVGPFVALLAVTLQEGRGDRGKIALPVAYQSLP
ncbi:hypothetical protein FOHLNKBM_5529 [Methylobacterium longum]|uniref:hypothetical protein n=1 Tax=Methylobacterium longum TaxID=767694 RepID=UPI001EE1BC5C|nr:hypothetical protein [Methylobacterium longum]GJE14454.1 hypothetical protein FOHLNKBM_5529 [Methylobacterium longum]